MASKLEMAAYKLFENEMKERFLLLKNKYVLSFDLIQAEAPFIGSQGN
jgi:hypothetical protein